MHHLTALQRLIAERHWLAVGNLGLPNLCIQIGLTLTLTFQ